VHMPSVRQKRVLRVARAVAEDTAAIKSSLTLSQFAIIFCFVSLLLGMGAGGELYEATHMLCGTAAGSARSHRSTQPIRAPVVIPPWLAKAAREEPRNLGTVPVLSD
jgi:hypothetical protein